MSTSELLSAFFGIVILSICLTYYTTKALYGIKPPYKIKSFIIIFFSWLFIHLALSIDYTESEQINRFVKSDKIYYLEQYKKEDLILDKQTYYKLKSLGNGASLYISQTFLVVTINSDNKEERYRISEKAYNNLLDNKETSVDVKRDTWGNKYVKSSLYE